MRFGCPEIRPMSFRIATVIVCCVPLVSPAGDPASDIAREIDRHLTKIWSIRGIHPAPPASDTEFLRRVSLDLIGRIPTIEEITAYEQVCSPDKKSRLLDRLLTSKEHAIHMASVTRVEWMPQSLTNFRRQFAGAEFEGWLETQFQTNTPYDKMVRLILEAPAIVGQRGLVSFDRPSGGDKQALSAFFELAEGKPEEMAAAASRLFLGVKLECAQCHDHPFAPYSREQFWEFAAFFGEFTPLSPVAPSFVGPLTPQYESNRIQIPNTSREVTARYFTGGEPAWTTERSPRKELADWLTASDNRLFARNFANRSWAHLFGIGLIDPIDEPGEANPPSHPAVLDALMDAAIRTKYDQRVILKAIALSRAYGTSGTLTHPSQADPKQFARMTAKGLTGHQIFDSLNTAAGKPPHQQADSPGSRRNAVSEATGGSRGEFVSRFPQSNHRTESATSILQSLMLMNGKYVTDLLKAENNPLLKSLNDKPASEQIRTLFRAVLGRDPSSEERMKFESYLKSGGASNNPVQRQADLFWILVNGTEFLLNH
jgi:hypothetical protein